MEADCEEVNQSDHCSPIMVLSLRIHMITNIY